VLVVLGCGTSASASDLTFCAGIVREVGSSKLVSGASWHCDANILTAFLEAAHSSEANRRAGSTCSGNCLKPILIRPAGNLDEWYFSIAAEIISGFLSDGVRNELRATDTQTTLTYLRATAQRKAKSLNNKKKSQNDQNESTKMALKQFIASQVDDTSIGVLAGENAIRDLNTIVLEHAEQLEPLEERYLQLLNRHVDYKNSEQQLIEQIDTALRPASAQDATSHGVSALVVELLGIYETQRDASNNMMIQAQQLQVDARRLSRRLHEDFDRIIKQPMHDETRTSLSQRLEGFADGAGRLADLSGRIAGYAQRRMRWVDKAIEQAHEQVEKRTNLLRQSEIAEERDDVFSENERAWASSAFANKVRALLARYSEDPRVSTSTNLRYMTERFVAAGDIEQMGRVCDNMLAVAKGWMETGCNYLDFDRASAEAYLNTGALRTLRRYARSLKRRVVGHQTLLAHLDELVEQQRTEKAILIYDTVLRSSDERNTEVE
jgi:hypothetical protein